MIGFQVEETTWAKVRNHTESLGNYKCHCIAGVQGQEWQAVRVKIPAGTASDEGPPITVIGV